MKPNIYLPDPAWQFELEVLEGSKRLKTATTDIVEEISAFLHSFGFSEVSHLRFFDRQLGSAVGAIEYVRGSGNRLLTSISL